MNTEEYFKESLIFFLEEDNKKSVLENLSDKLYDVGYVKETFKAAVLAREEIFPTGLPVEGHGVAIPHTDSEHVNKPAIAVGILKEPVSFQQMGASDEEVQVKLVFMLVVKDGTEQVNVLQMIIDLIQNESMINKIMKADSEIDVVTLLNNFSKVS